MDKFRDIGAFPWKHGQFQMVVLHPQAGVSLEGSLSYHPAPGFQKVMVSPPSTVITCPVR